MLTTAKQKQIVKLVAIMVFVAVILLGMGIGIYFIVRDDSSTLLSKRERAFGEAVNNYSKAPEKVRLNLNNLPDDLAVNDIVIYNGSYVVSKTETSVYKIYNLYAEEYVSLNIGDFEDVSAILGNFAIIKQNGARKLVSLTSGYIVSDLSNVAVTNKGDYIYLRSLTKQELVYFENGETVSNLGAVVIDTYTGNRVFNVLLNQECINVELYDKFIVASYVDRTDIFELDSGAVLIKTYQNLGQTVTTGGNLTSTITGKEYFMTTYYRALELETNMLLIEASVTKNQSSTDYDISSRLSDGQICNYKNEYLVYDLTSNLEFGLSNHGNVLRPIKTNLGAGYFAVLECEIVNKTQISEVSQVVHYYQVDKSKSDYQLYEIVSYDYIKYGGVVGFNGTSLITSGANGSTVVSFKGVESDLLNLVSGSRVSLANYNDVIVVSSSIGQKELFTSSGKKLIDRFFMRVSPFTNGKAVAFDGQDYYLLSSKGEKSLIQDFATEFDTYVFMGIDFYFTTNANGTYNVYNLSGEKLYQSVRVAINYDNYNNLVVITISDQNAVYLVVPIDPSVASNLLQTQEGQEVDGSSQMSFVDKKATFVASNSGAKNLLSGDEVLEATSIEVDATSGVGLATYNLDLNLSSLSSAFKGYEDLTQEELALLPAFDDTTARCYKTTIGSVQYYFTFDGLYTITGENFVVAIIRLITSSTASLDANVNTTDYYYMATIAFKDTYLAYLDATSTDSNQEESSVYYYETKKSVATMDNSNNVRAGASLNGFAITYLESYFIGGRGVNYANAGYDGGLVLSTNLATNLKIDFVLRNTYYATNLASDYIKWTDFKDTTSSFSIDNGSYSLSMLNTPDGYVIKIVANAGYVISGYSLIYARESTATYGEIEDVQTSVVNGPTIYSYQLGLKEEYEYVKFSNISIVENYSILKFVDYDGTELYRLNHFYGYGEDVSADTRNPAYFGFDNFSRVTEVETPTRVGYDFLSFTVPYSGTPVSVVNAIGQFLTDREYCFDTEGQTEIKTFTLTANYQAKTFTVTYVSEGQTILDGQTIVTFDQEMGELYDVVSSRYNNEGCDFGGWFDAEGNEFTSETIYTLVQDLTLYAKWTPKVYTLELVSNIDTYQNLTLLGYVYNITDVYFATAFQEFAQGAEFGDSLTKEITYNETYGELPKLIGYNSDYVDGEERYVFVGWFDTPQVTEQDGNVQRGTQYTSDSSVPAHPVTTLYAHYTREVLYFDLNILGLNDAVDNDIVINNTSKLSYSGSTSWGEKAQYSTSTEGVESVREWSGQSISGGINYKMYVLQAEALSSSIEVGEGYYISAIQIKVFLADGTYETHNLTGVWSSSDKEEYAISGLGSVEGITVTPSGFDVTLAFSAVFDGFVDANGIKYAEINVNLEAMRFENNLSVALSDGQTTSLGTFTGNGLVDNGNGNYEHSSIVYGKQNEYKILPNGAISNGNSAVTYDYYLKNIDIDGTQLEFTYNYEKDNNKYIHNLTAYDFVKDVSYDASGNRTETYTVGNVKLVIYLNLTTNSYTYTLVTVSKEDHNIAVEFGEIEANTVVNITNASSESTQVEGVKVNGTYYKDNESSATVLSGGSFAGLKPSEKLRYLITPTDNNFITQITVRYNGVLYNFANPTMAVSDSVVLSIKQNFNIVASTELFSRTSGNKAVLVSSGFSIEWVESTRGVEIIVNDIGADLEVNIEYLEYRLLQVKVQEEREGTFDIVIKGGTADYIDKDLDEIALTTMSSVVTSGVYKTFISSLSSYSYLIVGLEKGITTLELTTYLSDLLSYKINKESITSSVTLNQELTQADIDLTTSYLASVTIEAAMGYLGMESYLGRGGETFVLDPMTGYGLLSVLEAIYYNSDSELTTERYYENYAKVMFVGTNIKFRLYEIDGYYYYSATLFSTDNGNIEITPTSQVSGTDDNGSYREFEYTINDYSKINYLFKVYQKAIEYTIKYDSADDGVNVATGSTPDSVHVYNVPSRLSVNGYSRVGYTFIGLSKQKMTGNGLTEQDIDYTSNQLLNENLSSTQGDVVTLYAVFKANNYNIVFNSNDSSASNGSSPSEIVTEGETLVTFDHAIGTLRVVKRQGYVFVGWYSGTGTDAVKINEGDVITLDLFNQLNVDENNINIYAKYTAITYNVTINKNDVNSGNGSTEAVGTIPEDLTITYDQEFTLPSLTRLGYDFMGYKSIKLTSTSAKTNSLSYLGNGENSKNVIDYSVGSSGSGYYLEIDDENRTITLYAVYIAKTLKGYVNLNNKTLNTYGEADGKFTVTYGSSVASTSNDYTTVYVPVDFDSTFGTLPSVTTIGYDFVGFFITSEFDPDTTSSENQITSSTVLDLSLFNQLTYTSSVGAVTSLSDNYSSGTYNFSLYAHYKNKQYTITYSAGNTRANSFHMQTVSSYSDYDYSTTTTSDVSKVLAMSYGQSGVVDILTKTGTYVSTLTISYITSSGATNYINITFTWDSSKKVTMTVNDTTSTKTGAFISLLGATSYVAKGVYIKILPYNINGLTDNSNSVTDACRIIIGFDTVKTNFNVSASADNQTYKVSFYRYFASGYEDYDITIPDYYLYDGEYTYGQLVTNSDLTHVYTPSFQFVAWYYGALSEGVPVDPTVNTGTKIKVGDAIKEDKVFVSLYAVSLKQAVNFYMWNLSTASYELRTETSADYVLCYYDGSSWIYGSKNGEYYDLAGTSGGSVKPTGGKILKFPTPSSEIWPIGTSFVGYIVTNQAPTSGYYTWSNASSFTVFDSSYMIEGEINVYAVYETTNFDLMMQVSSDEASIEAKCDYALFDINDNGEVISYIYSDLYLVTLSATQFASYQTVISNSNETAETALRTALGGNLSEDTIKQFMSDDYVAVSDAGVDNLYFFAITIKENASGEKYIYLISDNYYKYSGGTLTSQSSR